MKLHYVAVLAFFCLMTPFFSAQAQDQETAVVEPETGRQQEGREKTSARSPEEKAGGEYSMSPVVVTATRTEVPLSEVTKSIGVAERKDYELQEQSFVPDVLDTMPGVMVQENGGPGQYTSIDIRGAGSQHVLFQFNGIPMKDAADAQSSLQYFTGDLFGGTTIDRVEVLRGTNSTLYGSAAMGGVVNIIPERWNRGILAEVRSEAGEYNTFIESGRFGFGQERCYFNFNPVYVDTDGVKNGGPNGYYYNDLGFTAGGGVKFGKDMTLEISSFFSESDMAMSEINPALDANHNPVVTRASNDDHRESRINLTGAAFSQQVCPLWDYTVKAAYGDTERHYFWSTIPGYQSHYDGSTTYVEMQHNLHPAEWLTLTAGFDYDGASYDGREPLDPYAGDYTPEFFKYDWYGYDIFGQAQMVFLDKSLFLTGGLRYNDHEQFDSKVVGEASAAYIFKQTGTKIHAAFGTGYRTPSLYEIYGGYLYNGQLITIGNPDLEPEESTSYEAGVTQPLLNKKVNLGLTWFHIDFDNLIIYDGFANRYANANKAVSEGIEASVDIKPCKYLKLAAAYTHVDAEYKNESTGLWAPKEYWPENTVAFLAYVYPIERLTVACKVTWEAERLVPLYDPSYNRVLWEEPDSAKIDLAVTYKICRNHPAFRDMDVWMRVENLLDEDYTQSGFTMPGRWIYGGVKFTF